MMKLTVVKCTECGQTIGCELTTSVVDLKEVCTKCEMASNCHLSEVSDHFDILPITCFDCEVENGYYSFGRKSQKYALVSYWTLIQIEPKSRPKGTVLIGMCNELSTSLKSATKLINK